MILGAGGYGRTITDLASQLQTYQVICFLDDGQCGDEILGKCENYYLFNDGNTDFYPAFGNNELRLSWIDRLEGQGVRIATLIHPTAYISPTASCAVGAVILPKAVVNTGSHIGRGCIINLGAMIDHDCVIGDGAHICLGAIVKAENHIPSMIKIEAGIIVENSTY